MIIPHGKALIAYHAKCTDGFTAAWATAKKAQERYQIYLLPVSYDERSLREFRATACSDSYDAIYIVDFSVPIELLEELHFLIPESRITILDHHESAFKLYGYQKPLTRTSYMDTTIHGAQILLNNNQSGASLCWTHFHGSAHIPYLIQYVEDYDLWRFMYGDQTKWVSRYLREREQTIRSWDQVYTALEDKISRGAILDAGRKYQESHDLAVRIAVAAATEYTLGKYKVWAVECDPSLASDVGHALAERSGTFGVTYYHKEEDLLVYSLRGVEDFNVEPIAKSYGGGGHKGAAGFQARAFLLTPLEEGKGDSYE